MSEIIVVEAPSYDVIVDSGPKTVVVEDQSSVVTVAPEGEQGPPGPPGSVGGSRHTHIQSTPATDWPITHNLTYRPHVTVLLNSGQEISDGVRVDHIDENSLFVRSGIAIAGRAELS